MGKLKIIFDIAIRNLFASKINLVIGGIVFFGTVLVVVGGALLDSVDHAMSRSIRGSVAGDVQVYSAKSADELALFGQMGGGDPDLSPVTDFGRIEKTLLSVPNVKSVVPMGIGGAMVTSGNTVDLTLADLRDVVRAQKAHDSPELQARRESLKSHVQQIVTVLKEDRKRLDDVRKRTSEDNEADEVITRATQDTFWAGFDKDADASLEFLENKVAPLVADADLIFLRYAGTDLTDFQKSFDRMEIVDGGPVPPGQRGFLFSKRVYEDQLKMRSAHRMDKIKEQLDEGNKIESDATLQRYVKENRAQLREIDLQLDPQKTKKAVALLQKDLGSQTATLDGLLAELFDTNDSNFYKSFDIFYRDLAPLLQLYRLRVGDTLTIKAFTRSGYVESVNVKIYGTFQFKGLEKSTLSGALNLMDLMSFRQLYGYLTSDKLAEIKDIQNQAGAKEVTRDNAEAELFGNSDTARVVEAQATPGIINEDKHMSAETRLLNREDTLRRVYTKEQMDSGLVLNAAVLLKDPTKVAQAIKDIAAAADRDKLDLKVMSWQQASGIVGQFVFVAKLALVLSVGIIFLVIVVIMNNAVMMATLQRTREIGTLRAIGSQRGFVLSMIFIETVVLGVVFGGLGMVVSAVIMGVLHWHGIAAFNDQFYFFFSGPRLFPMIGAGNLIAGFIIVLLVSAISTLYPSFLAARVSPLRAMQSDE